MLMFLLPILSFQESRCDPITTNLKFNEQISLHCPGLYGASASIILEGKYSNPRYTCQGTISNNMLYFTVTEEYPYTKLSINDFSTDVHFEGSPNIVSSSMTFNKFSRRWNPFSLLIEFDANYYGKGTNKFEGVFVTNLDDVNNTDFQEILVSTNYVGDEYFFIPNSVEDGVYYFALHFHYIDGDKDSISNAVINQIRVINDSIKDRLFVMMRTNDVIFYGGHGYQINFMPLSSAPKFKLLFKLGEYSTNVDQYSIY